MIVMIATVFVAIFFLNYTVSVKQKLTIGVAYRIEYLDAAYSYDEDILKEEMDPPTVISLGFLHDVTEEFLNVGLIMNGDGGECLEGVIIPRKVMVGITQLEV